jgi:divalent metal cation (Fe/Co/Zn/Cd) transporter
MLRTGVPGSQQAAGANIGRSRRTPGLPLLLKHSCLSVWSFRPGWEGPMTGQDKKPPPESRLPEPISDTGRARGARAAVVACACSVAWAALVGVIAVAAGAITGSLALLAFGLDSVIDGSASGILVWRFRLELRHTGHPGHAEHRAAKIVGAAMLAAAGYVVAQAARSLIVQAQPGHSGVGLAVLAGSVLVLPWLGYIKLRLAQRLHSRALRGDGVLSAAGAALAAVALAGTAAGQSLGWWWADPAAASLIAVFLAEEGWRTLR